MLKTLQYSLVFFCIFLFSFQRAQAQNANQYSFTAVSSTFTPLTTGNIVSAVQQDDNNSPAINIGFSFPYCGNTYSSLIASSNGFISFGSPSYAVSYNDISSFGDLKPALLWLWDDISGAVGTCKYLTTGTAPNRVFTIEFLNWRWNWSSSYNPCISVQVKLYETTGVIEYIYRRENSFTAPANSPSASVGIVDGNATPTYLNIPNLGATPTASSTTFTTNLNTLPANGQLYRWAPSFCATSTTLPTTLTTTATSTTGCAGYTTTIGMTSNTTMPGVAGINYQLQYSVNGTTGWTNVNALTGSSTNSVTVYDTGYYRYELFCNTTSYNRFSTPVRVGVVSVTLPTLNDTFICGGQNLTLHSGAGLGMINRWYTTPSSQNPIYVGNDYTSLVQNTTTYYVASGDTAGGATTAIVGNGSVSSGGYDISPVNQFYQSNNMEFLYLASELTAAGFQAGKITSLGFYVNGLPSISTLPGYTVRIGAVPSTQTQLTSWISTATLSPVYSGNLTVNTIGWLNFPLATPFVWDGTSNIVIQVCHDLVNNYSSTGTVMSYNVTSSNRTYEYRDDYSSACPSSGYNSYMYTLPNLRLVINSVCESQRLPITVNVTTASDVTVTAAATSCIDNYMPLEVTSTLSNYDSYQWENAVPGSLFLDSLGTQPYITGTNASKVWIKATNAGTINTYLFSTNSVTSCSAIDTIVMQFTAQKPLVDLGGNIDTCVNSGDIIFLDAQNPGAAYTWDNSYNGRIRTITSSGTYWVEVVDGSTGCRTIDTIVVTMKPNPVSALGNDTSVCIDQHITLNAGNDGIGYFWNTGSNRNTIVADHSGDYIVFITGSNGCVLSDTINVSYNGNLPTADGIQIQNVGTRTFKFSIRNPLYVIGYQWNFGDGSPTVFQQSPTHTYTTNGNYVVTCYMSSSCGTIMDSMAVHIYSTGINDLSKDAGLKIYPNPANDQVNISIEDATVKLQSVKIMAADGRILFDKKFIESDEKTIDIKPLSSGIYQMIIETDKGSTIEKLIKN